MDFGCNYPRASPPSHTPQPEPKVFIFRTNKSSVEEYFHDIGNIIPNMMLRIRDDGNIPNLTLSFRDIMIETQNISSYVLIPDGIEVWSYKEFSKTLDKPHNEFIYDLLPNNNYKIVYKDRVILNLVARQEWVIFDS